jgi:BsuBI/PstI restriction endonuclease domain
LKKSELEFSDRTELIRAIIEEFGSRFFPSSTLIYVEGRDSNDFQQLSALGIKADSKMPNVIFHDTAQNCWILVESAIGHGIMDGKRRAELSRLFAGSESRCIYVTAFPSRIIMAPYMAKIAWETEVWIAAEPSHLIHFNGDRLLGPH